MSDLHLYDLTDLLHLLVRQELLHHQRLVPVTEHQVQQQ